MKAGLLLVAGARPHHHQHPRLALPLILLVLLLLPGTWAPANAHGTASSHGRSGIRRPCPPPSIGRAIQGRHEIMCMCPIAQKCFGGSSCSTVDLALVPSMVDAGVSGHRDIFPHQCNECSCYNPKNLTAQLMPTSKAQQLGNLLGRPLHVWTSPHILFKPEAAETRSRPVCLSPPMCIFGKHLVFPQMSKTQKQLLVDCGVDELVFSEELPSPSPILDERFLATHPVVDMTDRTLLGMTRLRNWHFPHLLFDAFWYLFVLEILSPATTAASSVGSSHPQFTHACIGSASTHANCSLNDWRSPRPASDKGRAETLSGPAREWMRRFAYPVERAESDTWSRAFLQWVLRSKGSGAGEESAPVEILERWQPNIAFCFNGLLASKWPFYRVTAPAFRYPAGIFSQSGLRSHANTFHRHFEEGPLGSVNTDQPQLVIDVLIVNRPPASGRHLHAVAHLMQSIRSDLKTYLAHILEGVLLAHESPTTGASTNDTPSNHRLNEQQQQHITMLYNAAQELKHLRIKVREVFLEGEAFRSQMSLFNSADVVISPHGAANANFVFLPQGAKVVEVFPFAYTPQQYRNLARAKGAQYSSLVARPDTKTFGACMQETKTNVPTQHLREVAAAWAAAAERVDAGEDTQSPQLEDNYEILNRSYVRSCLRQQHLHVSSKQLLSALAGLFFPITPVPSST